MDNYIGLSTQAVLEHHGIKGMKWGVHKLYDNHKKNLLYQYKKKGLSDKEAQEKLQKRIRNEKIALGTAAAVAAGVAAYGLVGGTIANEATTTLVRKHEEKQNKKKSEGRSR